MNAIRLKTIGAMATLIAVLGVDRVAAQGISWDAHRARMTRAELEDLHAQLLQASTSSGYSEALRAGARDRAAWVAERMRDGDFQVGDRVILIVRGEENLTDTFTVRPERTLDLPSVGAVPLKGVLRSELEDHLYEYLARYIRDPQLSARTLVRVAVVGQVNSPGFRLVAPEAPIADVLDEAGGVTRDADLRLIRIERGGRALWEGEILQAALAEGRTVDQLGLRAGDRIDVPARPSDRSWRILLTTVAPIVSIVVAAAQLF